MPKNIAHVTMEVKPGPVFGMGLELLRLVSEYSDLIPDWHGDEKKRLLEEAEMLANYLRREMKLKK